MSIFYWVEVDFYQFYRWILDESTIFIFNHKRNIIYYTVHVELRYRRAQ
jgi:hypothetical protein